MQDWNHVLMILYIFILMFIAKFIKEKLGIFKSIVIPTSLLAGFIGLIIGPEVIGRIPIPFFGKTVHIGLPYDPNFYVDLLYFFMIIAFVSLTLTNRGNKQNAKSVDSGIFIVATYLIQGIMGLGVLYFMVSTFWPEYFVGIGLMLPLALGQGPGLSSQVGSSWDIDSGLGYIQQFAITLSTIGFIVGGSVGVVILNYYIKKYNLRPVNLRELKGVGTKDVRFHSLKEVNFFDNLLTQVVWLSIVMGLTFVVSYILYHLLYPIDSSLANVLIGFSYLFGIFIAMGLKAFFRFLERRGHRTEALIDNYMMQNISSFALNVLITASVMSIQLETIKQYYPVLILISIVGTIGSFFFIVYFGRFVFQGKYENHYILAFYGMLTGVASTGLALLRGVDPELETETSDNAIVLGSAFATVVGFPLMILLGLQIRSFGEPLSNKYNIIVLAVLIIYFFILVGVLTYRVKRRQRVKK